MDAHEKNAVMISAHASLPAGPRDLLHDMLFLHARPRSAGFTRDAAALVRKGRSLRSVWRYLNILEDGDWIEVAPGPVSYPGGRPRRSPNTYRILAVAERHACQIGTILIPAESKIPSAGTGDSTAREAARAKWLPELLGGQEVSLPTNTQPAQCAEILAPSEPVCSEVAPIDPRLGGFSVSGFAPSFEVAKRDIRVSSDNQGHRTEPRQECPECPECPGDVRQNVRQEQGEKMRWNHPVCDPCSQPLRATHVLIRGAPGGRAQFCGWCATRTESGLTVRCDPAGVPYPDNPVDARLYVARFRHTALAGVATIAGPRGPIRLDRMSDAEAVYAAGQFHLIARNVGRIARQRAAAPPTVRRLGLS